MFPDISRQLQLNTTSHAFDGKKQRAQKFTAYQKKILIEIGLTLTGSVHCQVFFPVLSMVYLTDSTCLQVLKVPMTLSTFSKCFWGAGHKESGDGFGAKGTQASTQNES